MIEITGYIFDENDDLASVMDAILNRLRFGGCDDTDGDEEWIGRTGHRDMEDALEAMMPKEREIVRKYFYEDKRMLDISIEMNMEEKSVRLNSLVHPEKADSIDEVIDTEFEVEKN